MCPVGGDNATTKNACHPDYLCLFILLHLPLPPSFVTPRSTESYSSTHHSLTSANKTHHASDAADPCCQYYPQETCRYWVSTFCIDYTLSVCVPEITHSQPAQPCVLFITISTIWRLKKCQIPRHHPTQTVLRIGKPEPCFDWRTMWKYLQLNSSAKLFITYFCSGDRHICCTSEQSKITSRKFILLFTGIILWISFLLLIFPRIFWGPSSFSPVDHNPPLLKTLP